MAAFVANVGLNTKSRVGSTCGVRGRVVQCIAGIDVEKSNPAKAAFPVTGDGIVNKAESLKTLREMFLENGMQSPDLETLEWFLADRRYEVEEAYEKLNSMLAWKSRLEEVPVDHVQKEFMTGKAIFHEDKDKYGRKVLIVRASKHVSNQFPFESSERLIQTMMDDAVDSMDEGTETILSIVDMRGFGMKNSDVKLAQLLIDVFFSYYPRRLSELIVVDAPIVFQPMWGVIKPLLKKYASIVRFVKLRDVSGYFDKEAAKRVMADLDQ